MKSVVSLLIPLALAFLSHRAAAQPENLIPLSAPKSGAILQAPIFAPSFDALSPEARAAHKLDIWRQAMRVQRPIGAKSWILLDADSGRVLAAHNPDARMFPASTTKTLMALTALSAAGEAGLDRAITIGANPPKTGEQSINLLQGERFTLRELLQAALIKSANDACVAVAEGVAGSVPEFVAMMNAQARKVGATHSHFVNPHGLHDANHYTTARDLALIARAAMKFPFFNETVRTREATIHGNWKLGPTRLLVNRNRLLWRWNECDGAKTGYTKQAGRCLIASATREVKTVGENTSTCPFRLISVVMHARDSWSDCTQLLLYQGFAKWRPAQVAREGQEFGSVAVAGGLSTTAVAPRDFFCAERVGQPLEQRVHLRELRAPVKKGALVGALDLYDENRRVARVPLIAAHGVAVSFLGNIAPVAQLPPDQIWLGAILAAIVTAVALLIVKRHARKNSYGRTQTPTRRESRKPQPETQPEARSESREQFLERIGAPATALGTDARHAETRDAGSQQRSE